MHRLATIHTLPTTIETRYFWLSATETDIQCESMAKRVLITEPNNCE